MKLNSTFATLISCAFLMSPSTFASVLKLHPEMRSAEYQVALDNTPVTPAEDPEDAPLDQYLAYGKKNLDWVNQINSLRPDSSKISFSSEATQSGNGVYNPRIYNFTTIKGQWDLLQALLPQPLKDVIFNNAPLTTVLPVSERDFIEWLSQVDGAYQMAARYKLLKPFKKDYIESQEYDVRGYILFRDNATQAATDLANWTTLDNVQKDKYRSALIQICENNEITRDDCIDKFDQAAAAVKLTEMKDLYFDKAKDNYDSYFTIQAARKDVVWSSATPNVFTIPFTDPQNAQVKDYLQTNIQDEWKWNDWQLKLNFVTSTDPDTTHVVFQAGALPHVNDVAGSIITMDANSPFTEYDVQWTIRHEFGHVLGFPDCYAEFYDEELDAFVSYQLDVTNLMCSRRGHFKQTHFDELKRVYFK